MNFLSNKEKSNKKNINTPTFFNYFYFLHSEEDNCIVELSFLPSFISPTIAHKILKIGQHMLILHKEEVQSERWKTCISF